MGRGSAGQIIKRFGSDAGTVEEGYGGFVSKLTKAEESAFPFENDGLLSVGLTKLEYFAGLAMAGALGGEPGMHLLPDKLAADSVGHAKALIAELEKAQ